ncbi:hypothetical protein [Lentzea sp. NPDC051838]|uniref:hypothetical protein n=1 Tax=Lentzea sp. NPDC051838 TaxID=3154849 RepID=UPI003428759C
MRFWSVVAVVLSVVAVSIAANFLTSEQFSWTGGADQITTVASVGVAAAGTLVALFGLLAQWRSERSNRAVDDRWYGTAPGGRDYYAELERQRIEAMFSAEQVRGLERMLNQRDQLARQVNRRRDLIFLGSGAVLGALLGIPASWIADLIAQQF